jgi:hypothetical protein
MPAVRSRGAVVVDVEPASGSTTGVENEERQRIPFDQQAALEELERFGRDIERYREQRRAVGEQFENFIRSFETPRERPPIDITTPSLPRDATRPAVSAPPPVETAPEAARPEPPSPGLAVGEPAGFDAGRGPEAVAGEPSADLIPPASLPAPATEVTPAIIAREAALDVPAGALAPDAGAPDPSAIVAIEPRRAPAALSRSAFSTPVILGGALVVALAAGLLAMSLWNRAPESAPPAATTADAPPAAPAPTAAPAPAPPAAAARPTSGSELTTIRRVWMRVTVDGARVLEREVPAGTIVPLTAEKTIVIRTGDAGAVRLSMRGGAAAPLGREGEVVTRSFTVPPRPPADR